MKGKLSLTKHARKRIAQRVGSGGDVFKIARRALYQGISHNQTTGDLNKFLTGLYLSQRKGNNMKIYGDCVYMFDKTCLVTVIKIPYELMKYKNDMIKIK